MYSSHFSHEDNTQVGALPHFLFWAPQGQISLARHEAGVIKMFWEETIKARIQEKGKATYYPLIHRHHDIDIEGRALSKL